ncbi:MAG: PorV/PorQ family protein [Candidatus Marinimicrobia bacterium]|nr:PorV/PorQ family protein [Candidatus Neomarinimicrobiota bacterium]
MKHMKLKTISVLLIIFTFSRFGQAGNGFNKAGRTSFQFLKIGIGARATALGEACIANISGVDAILWNPAAVASIQNFETSFSYNQWLGDMNIMSGAIGYKVGGIGVVALDYVSLNYGDIPEALVTNTTGKLDTRTGEYFSGGDLQVGLALSKRFTNKLSIGIHTKYLREELFTYSTDLWAFDVGTYYHTGWKGVRLAMSAQNFASQARWLYTQQKIKQQYQLPLLFRIGTSIDLLGGPDLFFGGNPNKQRLSLNFDAIHSNDYAERLNIGMEYWLFNKFALRSGYRLNRDEGKFSAGGAINYKTSLIHMVIDYAFVDYDYLNAVHRFTIKLKF